MAKRTYRNNTNGVKMDKEDKMMKGPESPIMAIGLPDGDSIFAVNGTQVDVGTTGDSREFFVQHIPVGDKFSAFIDGPNALISTTLEELIKAFATARGYTTSVTPAVVEDYVEYSYQYLALILHLYRAQNASQIKSPAGLTIGRTLGSRPEGLTTMNDVANYIGDNASTLSALAFDGGLSISNSVWSKDYLANLVHVKLARGQVQAAVSLFGQFYAVNKGTSGVVIPVPSNLVSATSIATQKANLVTAMDGLRNTYPDLIDILHFVGFTNEIVNSLDFTRDQRGLTAPMVYDENFLAAYYNAFIPNPSISADDDLDLYWDYFGEFGPLNFADSVDLDGSRLFNHLFLRGLVSDHLQIEQFRSTAVDSFSGYYIPFSVGTDNVTISGLTHAQLDRAVGAMQQSVATPFPKIASASYYVLSEIAPGDFVMSAIVSSTVAEGYNSYKLPDSYDYYQYAKIADILMGDTNWRQQIQALTNMIRSASITRKS